MTEMENIMEHLGYPSVNALARVTGLSKSVMYYKYRRSWKELEDYILARVPHDMTLEKIIVQALKIGRDRLIGKETRRCGNFEESCQLPVVLRDSDDVYAIVWQDEHYTVLRPLTPQPNRDIYHVDMRLFQSGDLRRLANSTFNNLGYAMLRLQEEVDKRWSKSMSAN